uniref:V-type proton ATPase subunit a n=1 Tax=Meloidogyne incognita TaxID=6306 RepID=A0A914LFI3_MELIC
MVLMVQYPEYNKIRIKFDGLNSDFLNTILNHQNNAKREQLLSGMLQCPALIDGLNSKGEHILLFLARTVGRQLIEQEGYTKRSKRPGPTTTTTAYGVPIPEHDLEPPKFARKALDLEIGNWDVVKSLLDVAPYTMITFPFLFALMFGDLGHGLIMFLFGLYLVLKEKRLEAARINDEIFQIFFSGRYVIFLMGLFSIYTGFIYNDVFSKSFNIFGTSWGATDEYHNYTDNPERMLVLPPHIAYQKPTLNFLNSMKIKGSVISGISQMAFGIALSYYNFKHSESYLDINFTFIPQVIFLSCIFVYLCLEIVAKWLFFNNEGQYYFLGNYYPGARCAPSLLIGLINMFMMKSRKTGFTIDDESREPGPNCHLNYWYPGQGVTEFCLLVFALLAIPVMLLVKPLILWRQHKDALIGGIYMAHNKLLPQQFLQGKEGHKCLMKDLLMLIVFKIIIVHANLSEDGAEVIHHGGNSTTPTKKDLKEFDLGDTFVYQAIHTIEFALGCISHTASYLRLWALSLAHARGYYIGLQGGYLGAVLTYLVFLVFATMTVFILVIMEGLSAFLHALRLHWVEFQSKFYAGTGHLFMPFSFITVLEEARIAEETFN